MLSDLARQLSVEDIEIHILENNEGPPKRVR